MHDAVRHDERERAMQEKPENPVTEEGSGVRKGGAEIRMAALSVATGIAFMAFLLYQADIAGAWELLHVVSVTGVVSFSVFVFLTLSFGIAVTQIVYDTLMLGPVERRRQDEARQRELRRRQRESQGTDVATDATGVTDAMGGLTPVPVTGGEEPSGEELPMTGRHDPSGGDPS